MLTADPERLAATSIPRHVLQTLRESQIREVMVLGRRGPAEAAFTLPEMIGLAGIEDVDVLADGLEQETGLLLHATGRGQRSR